ncbi:DUF2786 domain-containing protein [Tomitella biformata]|uniref:DUF2786 domain-containing protein n=1 Tax=Tomitella biformata TaxID=630403 RepID=UPI001F2C9C00|nr:DUF2786 domain-containing protein [Tomitella biformata]
MYRDGAPDAEWDEFLFNVRSKHGGAPGEHRNTGPAGGRGYGFLMLNALSDAYERGWQPLDVVHVSERQSDRRDGPYAIVAVLFHALVGQARDRAPDDWVEQLDALAEREPGTGETAERLYQEDPDGGGLEAHLLMHGVDTDELAMVWRLMPPMSPLCERPSAWPKSRKRQARSSAATPGSSAEEAKAPDAKILGRIRGLLAKAESTDFPEEAETLTAKAQELITRYAIDSALLHRFDTGYDYSIRGKRVHLDNPYLKEKVQLLTEIGQVNSVRTVWSDKLAIATIVGAPADMEQVELLYTSLLIQATRAMQSTESRHTPQSTAAFRRAFLLGYAVRIGQRMREARETATAETAADAGVSMGELVPVLAARTAAVDLEFSRLFPQTKSSRSRSVDAAGWHAGSAAADRARLGVGGPGIER